MKIVFFGTPDYVLPVLKNLHKTFKTNEGVPIVAVVTQKPKPTGRKQHVEYSPVNKWAHDRNIPVFYNSIDLVNNQIKASVGILASFGQIISGEVISHFPQGIINIHPSLLPKYRGASPIPASIISGDKETGISFIKLDNKLDHGPIIAQFNEEILDNDTAEALRNRLFNKSAKVLVSLMPSYIKGKITPRQQNHNNASFTWQITKQNAFIPPQYLRATLQGHTLKGGWKMPFTKDFSLVPDAYTLDRFIRAMQTWPQAWTEISLDTNSKKLRRLKILKSHVKKAKTAKLILDEVQLEGKNPVSWRQFIEGYPKATFL